jgi:hypothetical protein
LELQLLEMELYLYRLQRVQLAEARLLDLQLHRHLVTQALVHQALYQLQIPMGLLAPTQLQQLTQMEHQLHQLHLTLQRLAQELAPPLQVEQFQYQLTLETTALEVS